MKKINKKIIKMFVLYILLVVILGHLLYYQNYFWFVIVLILYIEYRFFEDNAYFNNVYDELLFINKIIFKPKDIPLEEYKKESYFYESINYLLRYRKIKEGTTIQEINEAINDLKVNQEEGYDFYEYYQSFYNEKDIEKIQELNFHGYGLCVPATKLKLLIKNNKLYQWKYETLPFFEILEDR